ncbi:hypothetical protein QU38_00220, partial [Staphylococcus aureus]
PGAGRQALRPERAAGGAGAGVRNLYAASHQIRAGGTQHLRNWHEEQDCRWQDIAELLRLLQRLQELPDIAADQPGD